MKIFALIFLICLISIPLLSQSKTPQLGRENAGEELTKPPEQRDLSPSTPALDDPRKSREPAVSETVKPFTGEALPSSLSDSETQAWDMIIRAMEKDPYSSRLQTKQPPARLDNQSSTGSRTNVPNAGKRGGRGNSGSAGSEARSGEKANPSENERSHGNQNAASNDKGNTGKQERPKGWDEGEKKGWEGRDTPPGLRKHNKNRKRGN